MQSALRVGGVTPFASGILSVFSFFFFKKKNGEVVAVEKRVTHLVVTMAGDRKDMGRDRGMSLPWSVGP